MRQRVRESDAEGDETESKRVREIESERVKHREEEMKNKNEENIMYVRAFFVLLTDLLMSLVLIFSDRQRKVTSA